MPPDSLSPRGTPLRTLLLRTGVLLVALAAVLVYLYHFSGRQRPSPEYREKFFREQVAPHIAANQNANARALVRFQAAVHAQFEQYRRRVPAFVDDITGWGNRIKIAYEGTKELASSDKQKVERHVAEKFAMHIVGADALQRDVRRLLLEFRQGIEANRNEMLSRIEAAVVAEPSLDLASVNLSAAFVKELDAHVKTVATAAGKDSVQIGGLTLLTSVLTEEATRITVTAVLTRVAASFAAGAGASAVAAGGATAATTGAGAAGGSAAGPIGTASGVVVGIAVGFVVDWIMTSRLEAQLTSQCNDFLHKTEQALTTEPDSVAAQLEWAIRELDQAATPTLRHQLQLP